MLLTHVAGEPSAGGVDAEQSAPVASGQGSCRFMIWGHYTKNLIWYLFKGFLNVLKIRVWSPHRFGFPAFQFWARPLEMALVDAIKCPFQDSCKTHSWRFPLGTWMMHFIRFFFLSPEWQPKDALSFSEYPRIRKRNDKHWQTNLILFWIIVGYIKIY